MSGFDEVEQDAKLQAIIAWLRAATPFEWHRVALDFNWDEDLRPLIWILREKRCDWATVNLIFWRSNPECFLDSIPVTGGKYDVSQIFVDTSSPVYDGRYVYYEAIKGIVEDRFSRSRIFWKPDQYDRFDRLEYVTAEKELGITNSAVSKLGKLLLGLPIENDPPFYKRYPESFHGTYLIPMDDSPEVMARMPLKIRVSYAVSRKLKKVFAALEGVV